MKATSTKVIAITPAATPIPIDAATESPVEALEAAEDVWLAWLVCDVDDAFVVETEDDIVVVDVVTELGVLVLVEELVAVAPRVDYRKNPDVSLGSLLARKYLVRMIW